MLLVMSAEGSEEAPFKGMEYSEVSGCGFSIEGDASWLHVIAYLCIFTIGIIPAVLPGRSVHVHLASSPGSPSARIN